MKLSEISKKITIGLFGICTLAMLTTPVFAQDSQINLFGNKHVYSITVKKSGTLVVGARIVLSNSDDKSRSDFTFVKPDGLTGAITGYQQILGKRCSQPVYDTRGVETSCKEFQQPDYWSDYTYQYYPSDEKNTYKKINFTEDGNNVIFSLPTPIESAQNGAVIISYYLKGQTKGGLFGRSTFTFKSLGDEQVAKSVDVNIKFDSDLYYAQKRSDVSSGSKTSEAIPLSATSSINSTALDSFSSGLVGYSGFHKTGSDILPGENFIVSGTYANSWWGMYWYWIVILVLVLAAIVVLLWWLSRKKGNKDIKPPIVNSQLNKTAPEVHTNLSFKESISLKDFLISFVILLIAIGLPYIILAVMDKMPYNYISFFWTILIAFIAFGVIVAITFPIVKAVKEGWMKLVYIVLCYFILLTVAATVLYFVSTYRNSSNITTTVQDLSSPPVPIDMINPTSL